MSARRAGSHHLAAREHDELVGQLLGEVEVLLAQQDSHVAALAQQADQVAAAFQAGGNDYVTKPQRTSEVFACIGAHMQTARLLDQARAGRHPGRAQPGPVAAAVAMGKLRAGGRGEETERS